MLLTFVDRLIRKSIANSAFALSLILESNTLRRQSRGLTGFFWCKNRSEKFSPVTRHKKWKYNLTFQKLCQNTFLYLRKSNVYVAQKIVPFPFPLSWPSIAYWFTLVYFKKYIEPTPPPKYLFLLQFLSKRKVLLWRFMRHLFNYSLKKLQLWSLKGFYWKSNPCLGICNLHNVSKLINNSLCCT